MLTVVLTRRRAARDEFSTSDAPSGHNFMDICLPTDPLSMALLCRVIVFGIEPDAVYTSVHLRVITRHARCMQRGVCGAAICGAHRAAECRESPCGVALRQESLDVEALCRYLALKQHVVNILGSDQLHLHRVCQLGP